MKKIPLILAGILVFSALVTYIAQGKNPNSEEFSEFLSGTFTPGSQIDYGLWTATKHEIVIGNAEGDIPGSPLTFTLIIDRRFMEKEEKSFTDGIWKFVSSDESEISGIFNGKGTSLFSFTGKFVSNETDKSTGIYTKVKLQGDFSCELSPLSSYGNIWQYKAWWNGTVSSR